MPLFYFPLEREGDRLSDEEGMILPDVEAAWYQAVRSARDLIRAELMLGGRWEQQAIEIADETGDRVERVPLAEIANYAI
jgi:hypothetical protein